MEKETNSFFGYLMAISSFEDFLMGLENKQTNISRKGEIMDLKDGINQIYIQKNKFHLVENDFIKSLSFSKEDMGVNYYFNKGLCLGRARLFLENGGIESLETFKDNLDIHKNVQDYLEIIPKRLKDNVDFYHSFISFFVIISKLNIKVKIHMNEDDIKHFYDLYDGIFIKKIEEDSYEFKLTETIVYQILGRYIIDIKEQWEEVMSYGI